MERLDSKDSSVAACCQYTAQHSITLIILHLYLVQLGSIYTFFQVTLMGTWLAMVSMRMFSKEAVLHHTILN